MLIHVHPGSSTPIYTQIMEQVKHAVASGTMQMGEQLPAIRELALRLRINPNTVAKAYRELEHEGVLRSHKGKGMFIARRTDFLAKEEKERLLTERIDVMLVDALNLGFDQENVLALLEKRIACFKGFSQVGGTEE